MKVLIRCLFLFLPTLPLFAQTEKGASPINHNSSLITHNPQTYAVIAGISDYQDPAIPDLRFADKDAEAFAGFLQSPAGGKVNKDHLKVMLNEQATVAQFATALDWLLEVVQENDQVIIYFSGHGDVERKTLTQPGFLLCWDAPEKVYLAGGTLALPMFQEIISTLSVQNKAKTIVIADACRSGKLSGSSVGGAQLTNANLARQYANEIKILSCQPEEYSIEGEQWGGGRGAFSYHLMDGLLGMADSDADASVNLREIGRYLEDHVTKEVAPQNQNPVIVGNKTEKITDVLPEILEQLREGRTGQLEFFTATESRGIEDKILSSADSNAVALYLAFQQSILDKQFLEPATACAEYYYEQLRQDPQLEQLHSSIRRNYAAALQDDAQQVLNKLLKSDPWEVNRSLYSKNKNYGQYPKLVRRAADLLGKEHYMYKVLMARSYWFEGYINDESICACKNEQNARNIIPYYKKALTFQPDMPHAYMQLSAVYGIQMQQPDSAAYFAELALESVPNWVAVYDWVANSCLNTANHGNLSGAQKERYMSKAKKWLERGIAVDSNSILLLNDLGYWYSLKGEYVNEQLAYDRALAVDTTAITLVYKAEGYYLWGKYEAAAETFREYLKKDPENSQIFRLFEVYYLLGQDEKAKKLLREFLEADIKAKGFYKSIGMNIYSFYPEESIEIFKKSLEAVPPSAPVYNNLGFSYVFQQQKNYAENIRMLKKAIELDPDRALYHNNLGFGYLGQKEWDKAEKKFLQTRSLRADWAGSYVGRYQLYSLLGRRDEARKELEAGLAINAENFLYIFFDVIDFTLPASSNMESYIDEIEKIKPNFPLTYYYYAQYLSLRKKDVSAGFVQLEKALQNGYDNYSGLLTDIKLRNLRLDQEKWNTLVNNYFPDQYKDQ